VKDFRGRGAIVTGAASGIGLGIARALAREGTSVALLDIEREPLERARGEIERLGVRAFAHRIDVSEGEAMRAAAGAIEAQLGKVHLVFNNAGVELGARPLEAVEERDWEWLFGVNVFGVIHGIRHFVPLVRKHGEGGHVVNTASIGGFQVNPDFRLGPYAATKYAVVALSEALEQDLQGTGIGVSVLAPGSVNTRIADSSRNRPARLGGPWRDTANAKLRAALKEGLSGDEVGSRALAAIRAGEFYVFTHAESKPRVEARFRRVLEAFARLRP
jgi:NAD(P)-dependent dehydrogenase (short-subunit alcohol dehydrogenase family)